MAGSFFWGRQNDAASESKIAVAESTNVAALFGQSGSGKTSLSRALVGIWPVMAGEVRLDGSELAHYDWAKLGPAIGYLPQQGELAWDISVETLARLSHDCKNIIGTKDASADLTRPSRQRQFSGKDFIQLSGEDATALGFNAHGGTGCISVTANVAPKLCAEFQAATLAGDYATALAYQDRLMPLHEAIFLEPGLAGAKYGLSRLGLCGTEVRLPLVGLTDGTKARIDAAMRHAGLLA